MSSDGEASRAAAVAASQSSEQSLRALSEEINAVLRAEFANRRLQRLLQPRKADEANKPRWAPALATWAGGVGTLFAVAHLLKFLPGGDWLALGAAGFVAWRLESRWLPKLFFSGHTFRLMRMEGASDQADFPHSYLIAPTKSGTTGFGYEDWAAIRGAEPGHLLVSISDDKGKGIGAITLRKNERLPVSSWARDYYEDNALPPVSAAVQALALRFDDACDQYLRVGQKIESGRALQSRKGVKPAKSVEEAWAGIVVPDEVRGRLISLAAHFSSGSAAASRGLLLYGPPGTGKTLIAKALSESMQCKFFSLSLPDLKAGFVGQSGEKVAKLWEAAKAEERAVIFVDECEGVFGRRGSVTTDSFSEEIVQAFLAQWDGFEKQRSVWVIGATNRRDLIDPAVLSRFGEEVEVALPDQWQRQQILAVELLRRGVEQPLPDKAGEMTAGLGGRDLETLAGRIAREGTGLTLTTERLEALTKSFRRQGSSAVDETAKWESLVLPESTLRDLKASAQLMRNAEAAQARGLQVPRSLLLFGPPGTGKTQIARTLAMESGLTFIAAATADLKAGFIGQSGQKVKELFARARESSPCMLFLDELDIVATSRAGSADAFQQEIVGQLLQEMDGAKAQSQPVFVLAATNRQDDLDSAVLSRFSKRIEVALPDQQSRTELLRILLTGKPLGFDLDREVGGLAAKAQGASGRDLRNWVERAEQQAVARAFEQGVGIGGTTLELPDFLRSA
jgi:SpoVK/Ycf46/Vps4 family AAA+-type ATPase